MTLDNWTILGFVAQGFFFARFGVQWIVSEKLGRSVMPVAFWWLSVSGGAGLLAYAIHIRNPVFITGQLLGLLVYTRNLILIRRQRRSQPEVA
ncbi:MAG: lipid-A-disaccharide synthase N-terminal domain-containing protein [Planctomycetota bacterium]